MADEKQKCPMCSTKLKMINGRLTCKSCGYYYRNPNEQTGYNTGQPDYSRQPYAADRQYGSQPGGSAGTRYNTGTQYGTSAQKPGNTGASGGANRNSGQNKTGVRIAGIAAAIIIGSAVPIFINLFNDVFFSPEPSNYNKERAEALLNAMGYGDSASQTEKDGPASPNDQTLYVLGSSDNTDTAHLPESEFFQQVAEAVWEKDYRTITADEYASLTALQINRDEKYISYQLNYGNTQNLTFQSDSGKKLSDLTCFSGLEWLSIDDDLSQGDLDGLNNLYSVHVENSIKELSEIIPNPEGILELSVEDSIFSSSLEGIELFPNLQYLYVDYWALEDISALTQLPDLQGLALVDCDRLTDYSPLMELSNLTQLSLESVQLKSIDFIREMPGLTYLSVEDSMITNLDALTACPDIDSLYLDGNYYIEDYTGLASLENLVNLTLELNYSNNMPAFDNLGSLQQLTLKYANDLSILENAPNVTYLCLENCTSQGLEAITSMQKLTTLEIHSFTYYTESLEPLTHLSQLEALDLEDTYIYGNINEIFAIPTLSYLNLSGCRGIVDFDDLPVNENLLCLLLDNALIADAADYDPWGGWNSVSFADHYDFFSGFPNLTDLYLESTGIDSLEFVENLPCLQYLDITDNNVTSLKPLEKLPDFRVVWCGRNTILETLPENSSIMVITE